MSEETYLRALNDIEALKKKAEQLRLGEFGPTIERFKKAVLVYGIRPLDVFSTEDLSQDLGQGQGAGHGQAQTKPHVFGNSAASPAVSKAAPVANAGSPTNGTNVKYADGKGGTWTGRGRKPLWFINATAAGIAPEKFLVSASNPVSRSTVAVAQPAAQQRPQQAASVGAKKPHRGAVAPKYQNAQGDTWSGRGRKPQWFIDATAAGRAPETMLIHGANMSQPAASQPFRVPSSGGAVASAPKPHRGAVAPKYQNAQGDTWSGRGRKPQWFTDAIAGGRAPESMLIGNPAGRAPSPVAPHTQGAQMMEKARAQRTTATTSNSAKPPRKQGPGYRLGQHTWTGVGVRPRWFKEAIASGKSAEEMRMN